jgi:hypothetical protein
MGRRFVGFLQRRVRRRGAVALLKLITPYDPVGLRKIRIGNPGNKGVLGDGGYVMVDDFGAVAAALSIGVGADVSWDLDMAGRGIPVHQFDHTVAQLPTDHPLFRFNRRGVAAANSDTGLMETLEGMVAELGTEGDLVLKMDVEGAEWAAFEAASPEVMARFVQIVVEIHDPLNIDRKFPGSDRNLEVLRKLATTHQVIHVHANNFDKTDTVEGIKVPAVVELTYLRRNRARFSRSRETLPGPLDAANARHADIPIGELLKRR